jgi:hypothetical protein
MQSEPAMQRACQVLAGGAIGALVAALLAGAARGEPLAKAELTDFRAPLENYPPPNEAQAKTLLEGAKAEPQPGGWFLLTDVKLKTFSTNGTLELLAESPQCFFDSVRRTVSSAGPLQVRKADGTFYLEGEGFLLRPTDFNLTISNRVHTVIRNAPGRSSKP